MDSGKSLISIFQEFSSSIDNFHFGGAAGRWAFSCSATCEVIRIYHVYK